LVEKLLSASCKLITYMGGYLQQDKASSEGREELKVGLKLIVSVFQKIVAKEDPLRPTDDEKFAIYGFFDGLNFLFGLADFKAIKCIVNESLFTPLLSICTLD
jgi:hypothetical protein